MNETLATDLLKRYRSGNCTVAEQQLVEAWYQELVNTGELEYEEGEKESIQEAIETGLLQNMAAMEEEPYTPVRRLRVTGRTWWAAAIILISLSGAGYYLLNKKPAATVAKTDDTLKNDVAPGSNKAVLTLANGKTILLDDAANGVVAEEGSAKVVKPDDGQLVYSQKNDNSDESLSWNTLATPRSGQYQLVLPDGTKVWLNSESSIHYPIVFRGKERRVQITGEAYFEVVHNSNMPFIVDLPSTGGARGGQIEVLGTHFNVNAYNDESAIKTTLLQGKVKVVNDEWSMVNGQSTKKEQIAILKPGEQAVIPDRSKIQRVGNKQMQVRKADVEDVVAWKNGLFHFESADIKMVMRQLARWYDIEVVYEGASVKNDPLFVEISRNTKLSDVLKVLEESGSAKFSIQGRKVIVK
jgi:ferric-dicitrate binding protein FerR (iron transport regulator)